MNFIQEATELQPADQQLALEDHFLGHVAGDAQEQLFLAEELGLELVEVNLLDLLELLAGHVEQIRAAGIDVTLSDRMLLDLWKKFVLLAGTSGITAGTRQPLGVVRADEDMRAFFYRLMHETMAVGRAAGVAFPPDFSAELDRSVAAFPPTMKASMANDLDTGNRLELDWLAGKVVALGRRHGIPTPAHEAVYAMLKPYRMGRPR